MDGTQRARAFFGFTASVIGVGLVLQLGLSLAGDDEDAYFATVPGQVVNYLSFFTVLANLTVAITTALLAVRLDRSSTTFRVLRATGVIGLTVTGIVFHIALADLHELTGWDWVADRLLHLLGPILAPLGWVLFGPRRRVDRRVAWLTVVPPLAWLAYTLIRGAVVDDQFGSPYYPYPFLNADDLGYPVALLNCLMVAALFGLLAGGMVWIDRRLDERGIGVGSRSTANDRANSLDRWLPNGIHGGTAGVDTVEGRGPGR